jgi:hypothetical protein
MKNQSIYLRILKIYYPKTWEHLIRTNNLMSNSIILSTLDSNNFLHNHLNIRQS